MYIKCLAQFPPYGKCPMNGTSNKNDNTNKLIINAMLIYESQKEEIYNLILEKHVKVASSSRLKSFGTSFLQIL